MRKTWVEKLDNGRRPEVVALRKPGRSMPAGSKVLVATPRDVKSYIEHVPSGQAVSVETLRADLAAQYGADFSCPLVTGIFLRIVAEAALEELAAGKPLDQITPFWRVLDERSPAVKKIAGGAAFIRKMRQQEGLPLHPTDRDRLPATLERYRHASVRTRSPHPPQPAR